MGNLLQYTDKSVTIDNKLRILIAQINYKYKNGEIKYVRNKLNKKFTETKTFRKWHIGDPYSDGEIGTDLEIRQRKSNGVFEIKEHPFFIDDPEYYYNEPSKWTPYKFS